MKNSLYNKRHFREYLFYGALAALLYIVPVWIFLHIMDYGQLYLIYAGSIAFMALIGVYSYKLSRRRTEYKSSWMMVIAAHFAVLTGIVIAVILTTILCFVYIPGFMSGESSEQLLQNAPEVYNKNNAGLVLSLYLCATVENFGAAGFMALLGPYVFKIDQTRDKSAVLENNIDFKKVKVNQNNKSSLN